MSGQHHMQGGQQHFPQQPHHQGGPALPFVPVSPTPVNQGATGFMAMSQDHVMELVREFATCYAGTLNKHPYMLHNLYILLFSFLLNHIV